MRALAAALMCVAALAACDRGSDPLAQSRSLCADGDSPAAERVVACTALIDSGELNEASRAQTQAHRGAAHREAGEVTAALRDFEAVLRLDAENAEALEGRASILLASGQIDAAAPLIERLIASGQAPDRALLMKGDIAMQRGDYTAAIQDYDAALAHNERLALALAHRGRAKQRLADNAGALADYDAAIRADSDLVDARAGRCWLSLLADEQISRARTDAETAVAAAPENVEAQVCRGVLQLRGREWPGARASFEAALAVEPGNPTALFGRGVARRRAGDNDGTDDMNRARDFDGHIGATFDDLGVDTF